MKVMLICKGSLPSKFAFQEKKEKYSANGRLTMGCFLKDGWVAGTGE